MFWAGTGWHVEEILEKEKYHSEDFGIIQVAKNGPQYKNVKIAFIVPISPLKHQDTEQGHQQKLYLPGIQT